MAERLDAFFIRTRVPAVVDHFGSLFKFRFTDDPRGLTKELFLVLLRMNGVETSVSGNFFLTSAHADAHVDAIVHAVQESITTLIDEGFFCEVDEDHEIAIADAQRFRRLPRKMVKMKGLALTLSTLTSWRRSDVS
ncbi:MAG: hypothetical protein HC938_15075 [Nitrospira sp.]|nr:hypothetical protein [Nitrospira sp.]